MSRSRHRQRRRPRLALLSVVALLVGVAAPPAGAAEGGGIFGDARAAASSPAVAGIRLVTAPSVVNEDAGPTTVRVTASTLPAGTLVQSPVIVSVSVATNSIEAVDFAPVPGFDITIRPGTNYRTESFVVTPVDDQLNQDFAYLDVTGTAVQGTATLSVTPGHVFVINDDPLPKVSLQNTVLASENHGAFSFLISLDKPSGRTVKVSYSTENGTLIQSQGHQYSAARYRYATPGADYRDVAGSLAIPPGQTSGSVAVTLMDDTVDEPTESVLFTITGYTNAESVKSTIGADPRCAPYNQCTTVSCSTCNLINDNDPLAKASLENASAREDAGTLDFTLRFATPSEKFIQLAATTRDLSALGSQDFTPQTAATGRFLPNKLAVTLPVVLLDDKVIEGDETFELTVANSTGQVTIANATAIGTIVDDDTPALSITDASGDEGDALRFEIDLSSASTAVVEVDVNTSDGTAKNASDYNLIQGNMTFSPGETTRTILVRTIEDSVSEATETFTVTLSSPKNALLRDATAVGTILDDDAPSLSVADVSGDEGRPLDFVVSASSSSLATMTVVYGTKDGTALSGQDYLWRRGTLTFAAGTTSRTVTVPTLNDVLDEPAETFVLALATPTNATLAVSSADGTIVDNDPPRLSVAGVRRTEGRVFDFVVSASSASADQITVNYETRDSTATAGEDYQAAQGTLTFAPGETAKTVSVVTLNDTLDEPQERFTVNLSTPVNATLAVALADGTIFDNDTPPTLSVADVSGDEGSALDFVVSVSSASGRTVRVNYATANGTARSGQDYQAAQGALTFASGETSKTVSVATLGDALTEPAETFSLTLSSPVNATLAVTSADGTILDNNLSPLSVAGASGDEGSALDFVVSTPSASTDTITVNYATKDGTAVSAQDYQAVQGTLTFAPGETAKTVSVMTVNDVLDEPVETFALMLSTPKKATLAVVSANGTITDNDAAPELSVAGVSGDEGDIFGFVVSASAASGTTIRVNYGTADGTAVSSRDYRAARGTLAFAPGDTSKTVSVTTLVDVLDEPAETFVLTLSSPVNATLGTASASGTIVDDDAPPQLSVAGVSGDEGSALDFVVSASSMSGRTVTVNYGTADGTAVSAQDYQAAQGTLTFAPGEARKTVSVATLADALDEPAETFLLTLSSPVNATLGTASADGTIVDDDAAPQLSVAGVGGGEGSALDFVVSASSVSGHRVTVAYATTDGTAVAGQDYQTARGTLTIAPGETSAVVSVSTLVDAQSEPAENFVLTLSSPTNATLAASSAEGWILDSESGSQLSVAGGSSTEGGAINFLVITASTEGRTITVDYATTDGTAVAGRDYRAARGTLSLAPDAASRTVSVLTLDDAVNEGTETFVLTLSSPADVDFGTRTATGTIIDNDAAKVVLTASPASVPEGAGPTEVRVTAALEGARRDVATVVRVSVQGDSAQETADFATVPDFDVEIAAGAESGAGTFMLSPVDDDLEEADETLTVSGVADLAVDAATLSLQDDDGRPLVTFRVLLFEAASNPLRQGFLRVINNSTTPGTVAIEATGDAGDRREPVTLFIEPGHASHFNSVDLEEGNPAKRLSGGVGPSLRGDWRLKMTTSLDVDVLAYSRTKDTLSSTTNAFVTAMNEVAPTVDGRHRVAFFNPGANQAQSSILRLINTGLEDMEAVVTGIDDAGQASGTVRVAISSLDTLTLTADELETGVGEGIVGGSLGRGTGKWRLTISAGPALVAKALLLSVDKLTNLSSSRDVRTVPVFPPMSEPEWTGLLRVINRSPEAGEVTIAATDETGLEYEPLTLALGAGAATHVISSDLELGNEDKGLTGSTGAGRGNWRLELASPLDVHAVAYARSYDGFLTSIHDLVPQTNGIHRVNFFNPASNGTQVSWLHLLSDSDTDALVTISGKDDRGSSPGSPVRLRVPAGTVVKVPSLALESGQHDLIESGALGDGYGKWRLEVVSDQPLRVMSLLVSPTGHLSNVSTAIDPFGARKSAPAPGG